MSINQEYPTGEFTPAVTRRKFICRAAMGALGMMGMPAWAQKVAEAPPQLQNFIGADVFTRIITKAAAEQWNKLLISKLIGRVAMELEGTPYVGSTLEVSSDTEPCAVNLRGLDCFTFLEDALCMARMIQKGNSTREDFIAEVQLTRYRGGKPGDYTTRLHYASDWFVDNEKKGVLKNLTPDLPGAMPFTQKVGFMSQHPDKYRQLVAHPEMIPQIRRMEDAINARSLMYLPMNKLKAAERFLHTGDIVGVTTTEKGLDIAHVGLCIRPNGGALHFMDASSLRRNMKVTLEQGFSNYFTWSNELTGVMVARPMKAA